MRRRRTESRLQEYSPHVASRKAPAEAEKTKRLRGTSRPSAKVITSANKSRSKPLKKAATRVERPQNEVSPGYVRLSEGSPKTESVSQPQKEKRLPGRAQKTQKKCSPIP